MRPSSPRPLLGRFPPPPPHTIRAVPSTDRASSSSNMAPMGVQQINQQPTMSGASSSPQTPPLAQSARVTPTPSNEEGDEDGYSSSSLSDCTSEEDDWQQGSGSAPRKDTASTTRGQVFPDNYQPSRIAWTKTEDETLIASVKKHGQSWVRVKEDLDRAGGVSRPALSISKRYKRLALHAAEKREAAAAAAAAGQTTGSSNVPQQSRRVTKTIKAAPSNLEWNPRKVVPWSREEEVKLAAIGKRTERPMDLFPAFLAAFPRTHRTAGAIKVKWQAMQLKMSKEGNGSSSSSSSSRGGSQRASVPQYRPLQAGPSQSSAPAAVSSASGAHTQLMTGIPKQGRGPVPLTQETQVSSSAQGRRAAKEPRDGTTSTPSGFNPTPLTLSAAAAGDDNVDFAFPAHTPTSFEQQPSPSVADYTIARTTNGFLVQNLPPLYHLLILSPIKYRVIGPAQQQQQQQQTLEAPFVFKVAAEGSLQGVKLPQGTTTGISMKPVGCEGGVGGERQKEGREWCVETRYTAADGYEVVFQAMKG